MTLLHLDTEYNKVLVNMDNVTYILANVNGTSTLYFASTYNDNIVVTTPYENLLNLIREA